ncbi:MAG: hypothetical protein QGI45_03165, partial [Myxococcota bacterium]|nr:hypothetical protein [Myxococcota bacterium]
MNDKIQNKMPKMSGPVIFAVTIPLWLAVFVATWSHMAHGYAQASLWFESCVAAQAQILEVIAWSLMGQLFALTLWRTRRFSAVALLLVGT